MPDRIDYTFIADREGSLRLEGYVPAASVSKSGVTIATGFDLGQRNRSDLLALLLPMSLVDTLIPYLEVKGVEAEKLLEKSPLKITLLEATNIDKAVKQNFVTALAKRYDSSSENTSSTGFFDLPESAQTVIASLAFQYGNLATQTPRFWKLACSQDWAAAEKELRSFGDAYPSRRRLEAELLSRVSGLETGARR